MTDDELRAALAAADPAPRSVPPLSRELLERTMTSDLTSDLTTDRTTTLDTPARRRTWLPAAAAAVVVAAAAGAYALTAGGEDPVPTETRLALPGGDGAIIASCMPVEARFLADMPVALAGTVTAVSDEEVRLDVTRWYKGGDADTVVLTNLSPDMQALIGATDFRTGEDYLVSGTSEGTVNACGYTGPASADLQKVYDEAFPG